MPGTDDHIARNLEIKVACGDAGLRQVTGRLGTLGGSVADRLLQDDTYFRVPRGRLKLRTIAPLSGDTDPIVVRAELIAYQRADQAGSRWSSYRLAPVAAENASLLRETLALSLGTLVTVRKRREVAIVEHTRIHLDTVDGLGAFVELETVIADQTDAEAAAEHQRIVAALGLDRWPVVPGSYSDLVLAASAARDRLEASKAKTPNRGLLDTSSRPRFTCDAGRCPSGSSRAACPLAWRRCPARRSPLPAGP